MFFGGDFYQSFGAFLPAPDPTFLYNGFFPNVDNVLQKALYTDPTNVNARILSFNCTDLVNPNFKILVEGTNVLNKFASEEITIPGLSTPVYSVNKYNTITKLKRLGTYENFDIEIGYAEGQSQLLATNGSTTTHFVKIPAGTTSWGVYGFIPTTIKDLAQVEYLKAPVDDLLTGLNLSTPKPVRVDKSFGYIWIETTGTQTQPVTWVVGSKNLVI